MLWDKVAWSKGSGIGRGATFNWLVKEKLAFEQRFEESAGVGSVDVWEENILGKGNNPNAGVCVPWMSEA